MKRTLPLLLALATVATFSARADVAAKIKLSPEGQEIPCQLRWLPADKVYNITMKNPSTGAVSEQRKKADDIYSFVVAPPKSWQAIVGQLNKSPDAVVPQLQAIAKEYKMPCVLWDNGTTWATYQQGLKEGWSNPNENGECHGFMNRTTGQWNQPQMVQKINIQRKMFVSKCVVRYKHHSKIY